MRVRVKVRARVRVSVPSLALVLLVAVSTDGASGVLAISVVTGVAVLSFAGSGQTGLGLG